VCESSYFDRLSKGALHVVRGWISLPNARGCKRYQLPGQQLFQSLRCNITGSVIQEQTETQNELTVFDHFAAHALGLFVTENESKKKDYAALIQKFNRWLTNTIALEDASAATRTRPARNGSGSATPKHESSQTAALVNQILALTGQTENVCAMCGHSVSKDFAAHVVDLVYPRKVRHTLLSILRSQIYLVFGILGVHYTTTQ